MGCYLTNFAIRSNIAAVFTPELLSKVIAQISHVDSESRDLAIQTCIHFVKNRDKFGKDLDWTALEDLIPTMESSLQKIPKNSVISHGLARFLDLMVIHFLHFGGFEIPMMIINRKMNPI